MGRPSALTLDTLRFATVNSMAISIAGKFSGRRNRLNSLDGLSRPAASYAFDDFRNLVLDACLLNEVACNYYVCASRRCG